MIHRSSPTLLCSILLISATFAVAQTTPASADKGVGNPSANGPLPGTGRQDDRYRIGYRDKLNIQVFRHPDLSQAVTVTQNGTINLFRLPEPIVAACKTELELANDIAAAYRKDYLKNPEVQVTATEQLSQMVAVIDAVVKPGTFSLNRKVHLLELIALAGGPSKEAGSRVLVARMGSNAACNQTAGNDDRIELFNFKVSDLQQGKQTFMIQPGDVVSVQKADIVFVYGNANEQGQVEMKQPMTLRQAIASAGGTKSATNKSKVRIIRQKPGTSEHEEIIVDLNAVNNSKAQDPFLQPNDIIALSEDKMKSILNGVTRSFTQGLGALIYRPY